MSDNQTNTGIIRGTDKDDPLVGTKDADVIYGLAGDDTLEGKAGSDVLKGGIGTDTASYASSKKAVVINLTAAGGTGGDASGDVLISIENVTGSNHNDALTGDEGDNELRGLAGDDTLEGLAGDDTLIGGRSEDNSNVRFIRPHLPSPLNNDLTKDAISLGNNSKIIWSSSTIGATNTGETFLPFGELPNAVWYTWTAKTSGVLTISVPATNFSKGIAIYNESLTTRVNRAKSTTDTQTVTIPSYHSTYFISHWGRQEGVMDITLTHTPRDNDLLIGGPGNDTYVIDKNWERVIIIDDGGQIVFHKDFDLEAATVINRQSLTIKKDSSIHNEIIIDLFFQNKDAFSFACGNKKYNLIETSGQYKFELASK